MKTDGTAADEKEEELSQVVGKNSPFRRLLWILGYHSNEAMSIRAATGMYNAVCQQVDHGPLHDIAQMPPSFYSRWCASLL